jgi:microcin C transport system substrate-binding protein
MRALAVLTLLLTAMLPVPASAEQQVYIGHGIAMHGQPKYGPDFKHFEYVDPNAPKGGAVKMVALQTFNSLNRYIIKGVPAALLGLTTDTLLTGSADEAFSIYGLIAESIEVPEDRSWVTFNLRPEARFHDGSPITADDVIFSFNILVKKGRPFYRAYYGGVAKVEKLNDHKVKFTFKPGENREARSRSCPKITGKPGISKRRPWTRRSPTGPTGWRRSIPGGQSPIPG